MIYGSKKDTLANKQGKKLWRPRFLRTNRIVRIIELAKLISEATTLTVPDIVAVLLSLPKYMNLFMKEGHTVKLDGLGTFYLYGYSKGNGVETEDKVDASQFNRIVCKFNSEYIVNVDGSRTRALGNEVELINVKDIIKKAEANGDGVTKPGGNDDDDYEQDPNA